MSEVIHPKKPSEITTEWMNYALSKAGFCRKGAITKIKVEPLGPHVKGLLSAICRVNIECNSLVQDLPKSVVIKFPPESDVNKNFGNKMRVFEREQKFYRELADRCPARIPTCYFTLMDEANNDFILMIEDGKDWTPADQVDGLTVNQTKSAVLEIAKLHAYWWQSDELEKLTWMPEENRDHIRAFNDNWDEFKEEHNDVLNEQYLYIGDIIAQSGNKIEDLSKIGPRTIIHYDFRADNMLFNEKDEILIVDWQTALKSFGAFDVGRAVCGSHHGVLEKSHHLELLDLWYQQLLKLGVTNYTFDEAWRDYRIGIILSSYVPVAAHHFLSHEGSRGLSVLKAMIERIFFALNECEVLELLK